MAFVSSFLGAAATPRCRPCAIRGRSVGAQRRGRRPAAPAPPATTPTPAAARWRCAMALEVRKESLPASQLALEITVSPEDTKRAYDKFVAGMMKSAQLPGFRKGAAPRQVVINAAGRERVAAGVIEELVEQSAKEAMETEGVSAVGQSQLLSDAGQLVAAFRADGPFTFRIKVDVWPEARFTGDYRKCSVRVEEEPFQESLLDEALQEFRRREATYEDVPEAALAMGDRAVADMVGFRRDADSGERLERLPDVAEGSGVEISMEDGKYMAGFVEGLLGGRRGETRSVEVQFPASARGGLANMPAVFDITLNEVRKQRLPELDDELARSAAGKADVAELKADLRERLGDEVRRVNQAALNKAVEEKLGSLIEVELPETLVEQQTKSKFATFMSSLKSRGASDEQVKSMINKENYERYAQKARGEVEDSLRVSFAVQLVADSEGVVVDPQDVATEVELLRQEMKEEMDEDAAKDKVHATLQRDRVVELLAERWDIERVPRTAAAPMEGSGDAQS